ncbi:hypothetical protein V0288_00225 [Pannus brasiliensis CCIBt3594]|uniref:Uncharacterized protein n=1 Tax=Pannus brasiliensis CCIBt3594 TaxID=1427578 RepID=A0AAW9QND3_9CHRO
MYGWEQKIMDCIAIAKGVITNLRKEQQPSPESANVFWKGIYMTFDEAWAVIQAFEQEKASYLEWHRNTETGAGVTELVFRGLSQAAQGAGKGLKLFIPLVGDVVEGAAKNVENLGSQVGEGIREVNEQRHLPIFSELDQQIQSLKDAIEKVDRRPKN